jgi:hypothetical protein
MARETVSRLGDSLIPSLDRCTRMGFDHRGEPRWMSGNEGEKR